MMEKNKYGAARLVRLALERDDFEDLILDLPDAFFDLDAAGQLRVWEAMLAQINQGVREIDQLLKCCNQDSMISTN